MDLQTATAPTRATREALANIMMGLLSAYWPVQHEQPKLDPRQAKDKGILEAGLAWSAAT